MMNIKIDLVKVAIFACIGLVGGFMASEIQGARIIPTTYDIVLLMTGYLAASIAAWRRKT